MSSVRTTIGRGLGFAALACALVLAVGGVTAARADEAPAESSPPAPDASFEGFADHLEREGRPVVEDAGPTCQPGANDPVAVEMAHRRVVAELQARLQAEARARAAEHGGDPEIVVLNGRGYNYRAPTPGEQPPAPVTPPQD